MKPDVTFYRGHPVAICRERAEGAPPNGSRMVKTATGPGDTHPIGAGATLLGSSDGSAAGPEFAGTFLYCVEWDDRPGCPCFIHSSRIAPEARRMTAAQPASKRQISRMTAAWRDGAPEGLCVALDFPENTPGSGFSILRKLFRFRADCDRMVAKRGDRAIGEALRSVESLAASIKLGSANQADHFRFFGLVGWLEARGYIPSDENNGIGVLAITEEGDLAIFSGSQPPPEAVRPFERAGGTVERVELGGDGKGNTGVDAMLEAFIGASPVD
jgi:hypothetical protein